jgi:hypothetical protein
MMVSVVALLAVPAGASDFASKTQAEVLASRKCVAFAHGNQTECSYSFKGAQFVLVMDPSDPGANAFTVKAPRGNNRPESQMRGVMT